VWNLVKLLEKLTIIFDQIYAHEKINSNDYKCQIKDLVSI
jgi:hypothetical protein